MGTIPHKSMSCSGVDLVYTAIGGLTQYRVSEAGGLGGNPQKLIGCMVFEVSNSKIYSTFDGFLR